MKAKRPARKPASSPRAEDLSRLSRILGQIQSHAAKPGAWSQLEFPWAGGA